MYPSTPVIWPAKKETGQPTHAEVGIEQGGRIEKGIAVHYAVAHKHSVCKAGNHAEYPFLLAKFQVSLGIRRDCRACLPGFSRRSCTTAHGRRPVAGIAQADRFHRSIAHGVHAALCQHFNGHAAFGTPLGRARRSRAGGRAPLPQGHPGKLHMRADPWGS